MTILHRILVVLLTLALPALSGAQAQGGGVHDATAIEICADGASSIVYVDSEGQPVPADPACDCPACGHCLSPLLAIVPTAPACGTTLRSASVAGLSLAPLGIVARRPGLRLARGPPAPKAMP